MELFIDIESIPSQDPKILEMLSEDLVKEREEAIAAVKAPSNYKDPAKIEEFCVQQRARLVQEHTAKIEEAHLRTALDGLGHVCVVGYAFGDGDVQTMSVDDLTWDAEYRLLRGFFGEVEDHLDAGLLLVVGHNLVGFELPFLWKRAMVQGGNPPPIFPRDPKPWPDERTFDTMTTWAGPRGYITLKKLACVLGLRPEADIHGSEVWSLVQAGRLHDVVAHCARDVALVRDIYRRMTFRRGP